MHVDVAVVVMVTVVVVMMYTQAVSPVTR